MKVIIHSTAYVNGRATTRGVFKLHAFFFVVLLIHFDMARYCIGESWVRLRQIIGHRQLLHGMTVRNSVTTAKSKTSSLVYDLRTQYLNSVAPITQQIGTTTMHFLEVSGDIS